ncbi:MAG TPA: LLM class flavin-dependent oxidoreductase [Pelomicrobium sp.]|nr:LLM class flavin-dependent oxidoreductase [Pelomicrobium sp.]
MKFGVRLAVQGEMGAKGQGWDYARQMALEAEELGFDSVWLPDHVINAHMAKRTPMLENWTVLSALGALTRRVHFAGHTFNNSLRNPAVMAKMAATFDVMFGGRLIYSLGSAWFRHESESYGLPWDEHDDRVARLREALLIAKALWTQDEVDFNGRYYTLRHAYLEPKPVQKPHIPIWVPGDSPAIRDLAAEMGDVWLYYSKPPETIAAYAEDIKRRRGGKPMPMATSTVSLVGLADDEIRKWSVLYAEERKHRFAVPPTPQDVLNENLWGSTERCVERIRAWERAGVEHLIIQPIPPLQGMRAFAREVMPAFAGQATTVT